MSCRQGQTAVARKVAVAAGISATSSQAAAEVAAKGKSGPKLTTNRPRRPRAVRQTTRTYRKLPLKKKEKLWAAVGQAALARTEKEKQYRLNRAVRDFGPGLVAAAVADDLSRFKKEQDTWALERYRQLKEMLPAATEATKSQRQLKAPSGQATQVQTGTRKNVKSQAEPQARFFEQTGPAGKKEKPPARNRINLANVFSADELQQLSTQLLLGSAAARRQLKLLGSGASRGLGHSDPRVRDWVEQDRHNFRFLSEQVSQARRGQSEIDLSSLKNGERVDLWEFSKFEADRALRNIDHLQSGWSHLKGPTAAYLTGNHQLEARFFTHLAAQLEPTITTTMRDEAGVMEVG